MIGEATVRDLVMEVACGIAARKPGDSLTRFEKIQPKEARNVYGRDGAKALRCHIQTNAPSVRRLHYWQLENGTLEFSNVVTHDDETIYE